MKKQGMCFMVASLFGIGIFYLWAFMLVVRRSFLVGGVGKWDGLHNYIKVLTNQAFWVAMKNTIIFMVVCILVLLVLSLCMAWFLVEELPFQKYLKAGYLLPLAIPTSAIVFLWNLFFDAHGFINGILVKFGILELFRMEPQNWMASKYAFVILVAVYLWKNLGYYIILWVAALSLIPRETYDAAKVDGANGIQRFFKVTLPQLRASAYYILLFAVMSGFKVFREAYVVAGEYPSQNIYMIQHLLNNWYRDMDVGRLSSATVVLILFLTVFTMLIYHGWRERGQK